MKVLRTLALRLAPLIVGAALMAAVVGIARLGGQETNEEHAPVISDDQTLFGQSAAFSGPAKELGREMRLGIQAAFYEVNQAGRFTAVSWNLKPWTSLTIPTLRFTSLSGSLRKSRFSHLSE